MLVELLPGTKLIFLRSENIRSSFRFGKGRVGVTEPRFGPGRWSEAETAGQMPTRRVHTPHLGQKAEGQHTFGTFRGSTAVFTHLGDR